MRRASILINNFNYAQYLADAIDSALAQDWADLEVVVVDDGSTDDSRAVIERYGDRIVTVVQENGGQAAAFNSGFARATGDVVFFLDSDDWFLPGKISAVMGALNAHPGLGWCFHPLQYRGGTALAQPGATGVIDARDALLKGHAHGALAPATTGLCFQRRLLERMLPMPTRFRITADNFLKAAALAMSAGIVLDEPWAVQRIHGTNAFTGAAASDPRRAVIELEIANELRSRWPELRKYALRRGLGGLRAVYRLETVNRDVTDVARQFVADCTPRERLRVAASQLRWRLASGRNEQNR